MRKCGILLSISSLPSDYGIGTLGKSAYEFVDFLKKSGQYYWQILPLNPVSFGNSPYQSFSAFAFNPYYIDLDILVDEDLLKKEEILQFDWGDDPCRVDYSLMYKNRPEILKIAASRFDTQNRRYLNFCKDNKFWLDDYSLFMAVKEENGMRPLSSLPANFIKKDKDFLRRIKSELKGKIEYHRIVQFLFYRQWINLKKYANYNGVHIIGDMPIYVSADSSDIWSEPELFTVDRYMKPVYVAGCPPDAFSRHGQLWGNPLYNWTKHKESRYAWWLKRINQAQELFDVLRIDHFRGFYSYYRIEATEKTAENGSWVNNDGEALIEAITERFPRLQIIAEDLGFITDEIRRRMSASGFPGMKILQFGFGGGDSEHLPHNFTRNSVVYTGTHDNPTTTGWQTISPAESVAYAMDYFNVNFSGKLTSAFVRSALASVCDTAIIPMQDYLRQDNRSRINTPSTIGDNWIYRIKRENLDDNLTEKIFRLTKLYNRI